MLKKLENRINKWQTTTSTLIGITAGFLFRLYIFENQNSNMFTYIGIAFVIGLCTFILNNIISSFIENSKLVRRSVLGNNFIEGYWIQNIETESYGLMHTVQYSVLKISFDRTSLKIEGISFELDGSKTTANFYSHSSEFDGKILRYPFTVESLEFKNKINIFGRTELQFEKVGDLPESYFGTVESNVRKKPVKVRGEKIKDHLDINISSKRGRARLIEYIKKR